jgi:hypothetical protein
MSGSERLVLGRARARGGIDSTRRLGRGAFCRLITKCAGISNKK